MSTFNKLTEEQAKLLHAQAEQDVSKLTMSQARQLDIFIREYALSKARAQLPTGPWRSLCENIINSHFGTSLAVTEVLIALDCFPPWMNDERGEG